VVIAITISISTSLSFSFFLVTHYLLSTPRH